MNQPSSRPTRAANETDAQYVRRLHRYIRKHAPVHTRRYIWAFNSGRPWQRLIIPGMYYLAALIVTVVMVSFIVNLQKLNGPKSAFGDFSVVDLNVNTTQDVNNKKVETYTPNVEVRGKKIEVYNSSGQEFKSATPIHIKYTTEGKRLAAFTNAEGIVPIPTGYLYIFFVPALFLLFGLIFQFVYKGRVNDTYRKKAVEALKKGKDLPKN